MRAKEYLAHRRDDIYYYTYVKKAIRELYPLRDDKTRTEIYFNRYLFADARKRVEEDFVPREGEVDPSIALPVRLEMLHAMKEDDSFIYAYNIIAEGRNEFCDFATMKICEPKEENPYALQEMKEVYENAREEWQEAVEAIIHCLLEHFNIQLTEECLAKKNELWELFKEFYMSYCKPYVIKNQIEELRMILARKEVEIAMWEKTTDDLKKQLDRKTREAGKGGMTVMEIVLTFYYLFNELGLNFSNSDKTQWARFIHKLTGKSYQHIRGVLSIDFDRKSTLKNLRNVAALFKELFPLIEQKIVNDMAPVS